MDAQEYLESRVKVQQTYFSKTATKNKQCYYFVSMLKLIVSLCITGISSATGNCSLWSIVITILSAILALTEGVLLLYRYQENWILHRMTSEQLKHEKFLFEANSGEYKDMSTDEAYHVFVENIEGIIQNNNKQWKANYTTKKGNS